MMESSHSLTEGKGIKAHFPDYSFRHATMDAAMTTSQFTKRFEKPKHRRLLLTIDGVNLSLKALTRTSRQPAYVNIRIVTRVMMPIVKHLSLFNQKSPKLFLG